MLWECNAGLENYEGICLGPDLAPGVKSLLVVSDGGNAADEKFMVLRFRE